MKSWKYQNVLWEITRACNILREAMGLLCSRTQRKVSCVRLANTTTYRFLGAVCIYS